MTDAKFQTIARDNAISKMANGISDRVHEIAANAGISRFDVAIALANSCGQILADSKDMPRSVAIDRIHDLRKVMIGAYDLRDTKGEA